jgi:hypothetical protein
MKTSKKVKVNREQIEYVIDYLWEDELKGYRDHCDTGVNSGLPHIFEALARLRSSLDGVDMSAHGYLAKRYAEAFAARRYAAV